MQFSHAMLVPEASSYDGTDAGGVQGTDGDMSVDDPTAQPKNEDPVQAAPPELPAQDLRQYRQTVLQLLRPEETIKAALRWPHVPIRAMYDENSHANLISTAIAQCLLESNSTFQ